MKKKIIGIGFGVIAILVLISIVVLKSDSLKNTKWNGENFSVLSFEGGYNWSRGDDYAKGEYEVRKGREAEDTLDKCKEEYIANLQDFVPEGERFGIENEIEGFKKDVKSGSFIIEEKLTETVINGAKVKPRSNIYLAKITKVDGKKFLELKNTRTYRVKVFEESDGKEVEVSEPKVKAVKEVENIGFDYDIPANYVTSFSDKEILTLSSGSKSINVSAMRDTPLYGIIDEHPDAVDYAAKVKGYFSEEQMGPFMSYIFLFEKDGTTYQVEGNSKTDVVNFVNSIEA